MPVYTFTTRNRGASLVVGLLVLGAGAALLVLGLALLAGVAIVGGALGTGVIAYRALRGKLNPPIEGPSTTPTLDPSLEVFAEPRRLEPNAENDRHNSLIDD